jgi:formylglycine-generating enzyme required for sulfatase activity
VDKPDEFGKTLLVAMRECEQPDVEEVTTELEVKLAKLENAFLNSSRRWYVNSQGQTLVVIPNRVEQSTGEVNHSFAICSHEVTVAEFRRFRPQHRVEIYGEADATGERAVGFLDWHMAAAYCNWLSEQDGIPHDQWAYESAKANHISVDRTHFYLKRKEGAGELAGYRLPTDSEWLDACLAGSEGTFYFGEPIQLLDRYAAFINNSLDECKVVGTLLPNEYGLFDMVGNRSELARLTEGSGFAKKYQVAGIGGSYTQRAEIVHPRRIYPVNLNAITHSRGLRPCRSF